MTFLNTQLVKKVINSLLTDDVFIISFVKRDGSKRVLKCKNDKSIAKGATDKSRYNPDDYSLIHCFDVIDGAVKSISLNKVIYLEINGKKFNTNEQLRKII